MLISLLVLLSVSAFSQDTTSFKRLYIETSVGFGFPYVNDELQSPRNEIGIVDHLMRADSSVSVKPVQGTLGSGWRFGLNVGYMFHRNFGFELGFNYVRSLSILMSRTNSPTYKAEHLLFSTRVELTPQFVFMAGIQKWGIYSKTGVILPFWGVVESDITVSDQEGRVIESVVGGTFPEVHAEVSAKANTYAKFSYGFQSRLGVSYQATDWLSVFVEGSFSALSVQAKETVNHQVNIEFTNSVSGVVSNRTVDDFDEIDLRSVYVSELTENSNNPEYNSNVDASKPLEELDFKDNFNHLGASIGLRFYLK